MKKISSRTRAWAAITLSSVLALAACGSEENADPPATSAAVANTVPPTILPPATTAAAPITTAPTTTPPTTPPTSATATRQPVDEEANAKQAVIEAAEHAWYVFNEAKLDPTSDEKVQAAYDAYTGPARARIEDVIAEYRSQHLRSETSSVIPANVSVDSESIVVDSDHGAATVNVCNLGSNVMVEVGGNADGSDRVIDDSVTAHWTHESYTLSNNAWLKTDAEVIQDFPGSLTCAP